MVTDSVIRSLKVKYWRWDWLRERQTLREIARPMGLRWETHWHSG